MSLSIEVQCVGENDHCHWLMRVMRVMRGMTRRWRMRMRETMENMDLHCAVGDDDVGGDGDDYGDCCCGGCYC